MPQSDGRPRPTLRRIAELAAVSATTASLALRDHPRIPTETRRRVRLAADQLGYRPDPQVAKLMAQIRMNRPCCFQSTICALTSFSIDAEKPYLRDLLSGAQRRANELGYGFDIFRKPDRDTSVPALQRRLLNRGVEGVLLLPLVTPRIVTKWIDWRQFSVVGTTYSVLSPQFHRVVPHHFDNALAICARLRERGCRRIGLVLSPDQDVRVHHAISAATIWQGTLGGSEFVRPLLLDVMSSRKDAAALTSWFRAEHPDAIITEGDNHCRELTKMSELISSKRVALISATKTDPSLFAGIDELPQEIGATAIEQLAAMIQRGEKGVPASSKDTMIRGQWIESDSAHALSKISSLSELSVR
jgi:DNA-binding LacI/PurR family transcriptional regulator